MTEDIHGRAERLIDEERIEGLDEADHSWLAAHLAECPRCSAVANATTRALSAFRALPIELPRGLADRTRFRVRLRAGELREREPGSRILWALTIVSWAFGVASAPLVWRAFSWFGHWVDVPKPVWVTGVVLWWALPALIATGAVLMERRGREQEIE